MSYWSQSQSFYGQQGWTYLNARTTTKPSEGPHLPLLALASNRTLTLGVVAVASAALPIGRQKARTLGTVATVTAQALAVIPGGTHTDRVAGHIAGLTIGHIEALAASPGRTIGPRIGHLED